MAIFQQLCQTTRGYPLPLDSHHFPQYLMAICGYPHLFKATFHDKLIYQEFVQEMCGSVRVTLGNWASGLVNSNHSMNHNIGKYNMPKFDKPSHGLVPLVSQCSNGRMFFLFLATHTQVWASPDKKSLPVGHNLSPLSHPKISILVLKCNLLPCQPTLQAHCGPCSLVKSNFWLNPF